MRPGRLVLGLLVASARMNAQASPTSALPETSQILENIGKLVKDGHLAVEPDLQQGSMPVNPKYTLEVQGSPKTSVAIEAADGKVTHMKFGVENASRSPSRSLPKSVVEESLKKLFFQFCAPVASAHLVVDKALRAFLLRDVKVETRCKGGVGWGINFISPLLTKTYTDLKLFQMPPNLPLTVDSVRGGARLVEIGGSIDWAAGQAAPPSADRP